MTTAGRENIKKSRHKTVTFVLLNDKSIITQKGGSEVFFPEIDEKKTIANAKRKLREYPRWRRIANDIGGQKVTQTYSFDLRNPTGTPSRPVERLAINKVDAERELDAIEYAVTNLFDPLHRRIIYDKYLRTKTKKNWEIEGEIKYEKTQFHKLLSNALLAFSEQYRSGVLVVEKNGIFGE